MVASVTVNQVLLEGPVISVWQDSTISPPGDVQVIRCTFFLNDLVLVTFAQKSGPGCVKVG